MSARPSLAGDPPHLSEMHVVNFTGNYTEINAIASLQGIVNHHGPRIFHVKDSTDQFWCDYIISRVQPLAVYYYNNITALFAAFKDWVNGSVIYDTSSVDTRNIGIPFCGVHNATLVDNSLAMHLQISFGIPIFQALNFTGRWAPETPRWEIYHWAFNNYVINRTFNTTRIALQGSHTDLVDMLVQDSIFTLWNINSTISSDAELNFFKEVLDFFPSNSPVFGYPYPTGENEGKTVGLISEAGLYLVPSDFSTNLAFTRRLDFGQASYTQNRTWTANPPQLEKKLYLTFVISDGDNLQYVEGKMKWLWDQPAAHAGTPIGWSISPLAIEYAPHLVDYYYTNASGDDYFVAGPSGAGYIYPERMNDGNFSLYLQSSHHYMQKMDLQEVWPLGLGGPDRYQKYVVQVGVKGIFEGYSEDRWDKVGQAGNGVPVFTMYKNGTTAEDLISKLDQILAFNQWRLPLFIPVWVHCWTQDTAFIKAVADHFQQEGAPVVIVRPDLFVYLYELNAIPADYVIIGAGIVALVGLTLVLLWQGKARIKRGAPR